MRMEREQERNNSRNNRDNILDYYKREHDKGWHNNTVVIVTINIHSSFYTMRWNSHGYKKRNRNKMDVHISIPKYNASIFIIPLCFQHCNVLLC